MIDPIYVGYFMDAISKFRQLCEGLSSIKIGVLRGMWVLAGEKEGCTSDRRDDRNSTNIRDCS